MAPGAWFSFSPMSHDEAAADAEILRRTPSADEVTVNGRVYHWRGVGKTSIEVVARRIAVELPSGADDIATTLREIEALVSGLPEAERGELEHRILELRREIGLNPRVEGA